MPRPIMLGIVGGSGSGKTTVTRGIVSVICEDSVDPSPSDDYHRCGRKQRAERNITPLHPDSNYRDIVAQALRHLRAKEPIMKPEYDHANGSFKPPAYVDPKRFVVTEGLLAFHSDQLREMFDVRVYLD